MLGNCNYNPTSLYCADSSFCPLPNPQNSSFCQPCSQLLPGASCNCQLLLRLNCAACDGISCRKCISGHRLEGENCVLEDLCTGGFESCSHGNYCPIGVGERQCKSCFYVSSDSFCNCGGEALNSCKECAGRACARCLDKHQLVDGKCYKQADFGSCSVLADCQFGTFCKEGKCVSCSGISSEESCNCGDSIKGCKVCGQDETCLECAGNLLYSKGGTEDGLSFPNRGCIDPGVCLADSAFGCAVNFYCRLPDRTCQPCDNKISKPQGCYCGKRKQIDFCNYCDLISQEAKICFPSYVLIKHPVIGYSCYANYCTFNENYCQSNFYCPQNPIGTTTCLPCSKDSLVPCQCFYQENCKTCNLDTKKCDLCLKGFVKNKQDICVPETNICGKSGTSIMCDTQFTCQGNIGDKCAPCYKLELGQFCNCKKNIYQNCQECNEYRCSKCRREFLLENGKCVPNLCGNPLNTDNCIFGHYCPSEGSVADTICTICDNQQQDCNCGLITGCQTCGATENTCGSCFDGFELNSNQQCEIKQNICDYSGGSINCTSDNFCNAEFGAQCVSCSVLALGQFCKCGPILVENCVKCENEQCSQCVVGYFPLNGQCILNICNSGGPSSTCAFGNYCPPGDGEEIACELCDGKNTIPCQCGANNCLTCGSTYNSCKTCMFGYTLNSDNQCVLKNNICDLNNESSLCSSGYFCNSTFGNPCVNCINLTLNQLCNCDLHFIPNCIQCIGQKCFQCFKGFLLLSDGTCVQNSCDENKSSSTCYSGYQCSGQPGDSCDKCSIDIESQCSCQGAPNCKTCGQLDGTCETCLSGFTFNPQTLQCVEITPDTKNICDEKNTSQRCDNQYFCSGTYGDTCQFCSVLTAGYSCNCSSKLQKNCVFCENQECKFCIPGYYLQDGSCIVNKCGPNLPQKCVNGFYCPATDSETLCEQCSIQEIQCNCGTANNCQICSIQPDQCQACLIGFTMTNGLCVPQLACTSQTDCNLGEYCFENKCEKCGIQVGPCNCGSAENCQTCGPAGTCQSCLEGWAPNSQSSCSIPICHQQIPLGQFCDKPGITSPCPEDPQEIDQMQNACNCDEAKNCANCLPGNTACDDCMKGSVMINGVCFVETPGFTGDCKESGNSIFCMPGNACIIPEVCSSCEGVSTGFTCNCDGNLILNCTECNADKCEQCFTGFIQVNGECVPACYADDQCLIGEVCDLQINVCETCDGTAICNCGDFSKCTNCDEKTCLSCIEGYKVGITGDCDECAEGWIMNEEVIGECVVDESVRNKTLDIINYVGIAVGVASVVGIGIGIAVFYARRPKKYTFQHNFMSEQKKKVKEDSPLTD